MKLNIDIFGNKSNAKTKWIVLLLVSLSIALHVYMMVVSSAFIPVTSDEAIKILQAKQIASGTPKLFLWTQPYQFPMRSYMVAPIVNLLPRNGFGARFHSFATGLVSMAILLLIFIKMTPVQKSWSGAILILFPSAYFMMGQFGYPMLGYTSSFFFWALAMFLTMHISSTLDRKTMAIVALTGIICGLAFTNNMLSLAVVVPIAIVACLGNKFRSTVIKSATLSIGCLIGLLPYIAGILRYPTARGAVSGTKTLQSAVSRIWSPTLSSTLPHALGIDSPLFPDSHHTLGQPSWILTSMAIFYCMLLLFVTLFCIFEIVKPIIRKEWPHLSVREIAVGTSWLGLIMFLFSVRADIHSYRYLTPVVWCFPFIVYFTFIGLPKYARPVLGSIIIILAFYNAATTICLIEKWKEPEFAKRVVGAPDLSPALEFLKENGITNCVASHWAAYRINFLTDEKIRCSQPMNERFPGWPLPYKKQIDAATNVAYVLTERIRFLKPNIFERHLRTMDVSSKHLTKGDFEIYYDFKQNNPPKGGALLPHEFKIMANNNSSNVNKMADGNKESFWRSDCLQKSNMWIQVDLEHPVKLDRLCIFRGNFEKDLPNRLVVEKLTADGWEQIPYKTFNDWGDKFHFLNGHPVYGYTIVQSLLFDDIEVSTFRLRISEPREKWAWTITELEIFAKHN